MPPKKDGNENEDQAGPSGIKRGRLETKSAGTHESEEEESNSEEENTEITKEDTEEVQVTFEFFDPREDDFFYVKTFLTKYLDGAEFDSSGLANLVVSQKSVGTCIKPEGEGEVYGFVTVLNLQRHREETCIQEITAHILEKCDKPAHTEFFRMIFNEKSKVGLILNERLVNMPPEVSEPLHWGLHEEITWATEDEPTQELRDSFKFDHYVIMTTVCRVSERQAAASSSKKLKKLQKREAVSFLYLKVEDQVYREQSCLSFWYDLPQRPEEIAADSSAEFPRSRLVMVVPHKNIGAVLRQLQTLFPPHDSQ